VKTSSLKMRWIPWTEWECYAGGMYDGPSSLSKEEGEQQYMQFLADIKGFQAAMHRVVAEWPKSCDHFLTKQGMNRVAWMGQAAACIAHGLPRRFRGGFHLLSNEQQIAANAAAQGAIDEWEAAQPDCQLRQDMAQQRLF
jgi:hypothetical protein